MADDKDTKKSLNPIKLGLGVLASISGNVNPSVKLQSEYICFDELPCRIPDINQIMQLNWQGKLSETDFIKYMGYCGYSEGWIPYLKSAYKQYLSSHEYAILLNRGKITQAEYQQKLKELNMIEEQNNLKNIVEYFPTIEDLVRFAVREAYTPATEEKFGQLKEIPPIFLTEAKKAGLPEEQAKHFWSAHWELPSLSLGFEMFHRTTTNKIDNDADEIKLPSGASVYNVIGKKTLELLAKSQDVMPFWRDKITAVSYNPLTRVDIRRMYAAGSIDEDKVFRSYLDGGYNEENALALTDFVIKEYSQEMHGITRATLTKAYHEDIINEAEFRDQLKLLKMSDHTIDFYVSLADYDKLMDKLKSLVESLSIQVQDGTITIDEFRNRLSSEDVPAAFIDQQIIKVSQKRNIKIKMPTIEDCKRWFKNNLIDESNFRQRLKMLGYIAQDIDLYVLEIK